MEIGRLGSGHAPIVPEAVVHHAQRARRVLVVVRETAGEEELHDGRPRCGAHPQQRGQTVTVHTHHDLRRIVRTKLISSEDSSQLYAQTKSAAPLATCGPCSQH